MSKLRKREYVKRNFVAREESLRHRKAGPHKIEKKRGGSRNILKDLEKEFDENETDNSGE